MNSKYILCRQWSERPYELLGKWLVHDRFGLDVKFMQDILERLSGMQVSLHHELISNRNKYSSLPRVENGFIVI
jgi:hypothetical protein